MSWKRSEIAEIMLSRLEACRDGVRAEFALARTVKSFVVDELFPAELAELIASSFPPVESMVLKKHLGELKYVGVQMNQYKPLLEETICRPVLKISAVTGCGLPQLLQSTIRLLDELEQPAE